MGTALRWSPLTRELTKEGEFQNTADVAMCELLSGVAADFKLYDSNAGASHSGDRKIRSGTAEPTEQMTLTVLGNSSGERTVTVTGLNHTYINGDYGLNGVVELNYTGKKVVLGDSGAPCLLDLGNGEYRMVCIAIAADVSRRKVLAFPASVAQEHLGITFGNDTPEADAGPEQAVRPGSVVMLDGSGSLDSDGDNLAYRWEQLAAAGQPTVQLSGTNTAKPTFTVPAGATELAFRLTVQDPYGETAADEVKVWVTNEVLSANAGPDQTVNTGEVVTLNGSENTRRTGLTWKWEQLPGGPRVNLDSLAASTTGFTAPNGAALLKFRLTATNSRGVQDSDDVTVTVQNRAPEAEAGPNQSVGINSLVELSGSGSDPDQDDTLTYLWTRWRGPTVRLYDHTAPVTSFNSPSEPANLWFRLTVMDNHGASSDDRVKIAVELTPTPETWGSWSRTGKYRGSGSGREAEESQSSNLGNIQTRWVSAPEDDWGLWSRTGKYRGSGLTRKAEESRLSNLGNTQTRWISDPEPEVWGDWLDTGAVRQIGAISEWEKEQKRTSNYGNAETRWVYAHTGPG